MESYVLLVYQGGQNDSPVSQAQWESWLAQLSGNQHFSYNASQKP